MLALGSVLAVAAYVALPGPILASDPPSVEAMVSRIWDGSTLDAQVEGRRTAVGYLGAETPAPNRPCGPEALERNRQLAGGRVLLEADPAYEFDAIGRRLYYAYTPDGVSIEATLIGEGLARAVRTDASHGADLLAIQAEAEAAGLGCLWASS
jgi:endonuclease YncB( thermonuclease family)